TDSVYVHPNGQALDVGLKGRGRLFKSQEEFLQAVQRYEELSKRGWRHILKGRPLYGQDFIDHVPELIDQLAENFKIPRNELDMSAGSLKKVEAKAKRFGREKCLLPEYFAPLVAYIGEMMRQEINGRWVMILSTRDKEVWEPWIVDSKDLYCNSWSALYDMFSEGGIWISAYPSLEVKLRQPWAEPSSQLNAVSQWAPAAGFIPTDPPDSKSEA
ncbi:MAG: hypothetical protein H7Y09_06775, partial [Chitinophagaceae bacterium]|nr:hypothetical protein [Anaerolineae bacterium]